MGGVMKGGKKEEERQLSIGTPFNVQHNIHVDFNSVTGFEVIPFSSRFHILFFVFFLL
jgi:hypothetical protein